MADAGEFGGRLEQAERAALSFKKQAATALETVRQVCRTLELSETTRRKLLEALLEAEKEIEQLRRETAGLKEAQKAAKDAMAAAEAVRREGVEALEEARALAPKKKS